MTTGSSHTSTHGKDTIFENERIVAIPIHQPQGPQEWHPKRLKTASIMALSQPRRPQVLGTKVQLVRMIDVPRRMTCVGVQIVDGVLVESRGLSTVEDVLQARSIGEAEDAVSEYNSMLVVGASYFKLVQRVDIMVLTKAQT